jgi:hypothetical protein
VTLITAPAVPEASTTTPNVTTRAANTGLAQVRIVRLSPVDGSL